MFTEFINLHKNAILLDHVLLNKAIFSYYWIHIPIAIAAIYFNPYLFMAVIHLLLNFIKIMVIVDCYDYLGIGLASLGFFAAVYGWLKLDF